MTAEQRITAGRPKGSRNKPKAQATKPFGMTPPAQYDRMRAPVWTRSPAPPVRDGALDHQRIESRGFRC